MRSKGLLKKLGAGDWKEFAKGYNGTVYARNAYDAKLASDYARWTVALRPKDKLLAVAETVTDVSTLKLGSKGPRARALQESLLAFGILLKADADFGTATWRAVAAAQVELGLTGTGAADPGFIAQLEAAPLRVGALFYGRRRGRWAANEPSVLFTCSHPTAWAGRRPHPSSPPG